MNKIFVFMLLFFFVSGFFLSVFSSVSAAGLVADSWNTKMSMEHERTGCGFAVLDGKIYAIGGYDYVDTNERYDPLTNKWSTLAPIPTIRSHMAVVTYQGKIYCMGGITNNVGPGPAIYRALNVVEVYDPVTNSWICKAAVPLKGTYFYDTCYYEEMTAGVVNDQLFALASSGDLYMYNSSNDSWSSKAALSAENWHWQVYVANEHLFVITYSGEMQMYNPTTDSWIKKTSAPPSDTYVIYPFITVTDNKIIIGDHQKIDSSTDDNVQLNLRIYDPKTDKWSERKTNSKSITFYGGSMFIAGTSGVFAPKNLYIFGYEQITKDSFQAFTWVYDIVYDTWTTAKANNIFRNERDSQIVSVNDVFYLISSASNDQYVPIDYNSKGYYDTRPSATTTTPVSSEKNPISFLNNPLTIAALILTVCVGAGTLFSYLKPELFFVTPRF
ncbi:MAG: hypothetical protein FWC14_04445 [Candidatus Bathyarchaeota archaeon]|uniref:Kelch repeat-containing protein n=2 Tax=Candidatus Bathycorpusculum sp. TaxID=2994959 RepID=UPI00281B57C8|nr:hypothetical protein [Candidatus Termiticorpusculum sp.]MCL2292464.1 hypothetical protein [Candidatus Termiticorpusculum sp.]